MEPAADCVRKRVRRRGACRRVGVRRSVRACSSVRSFLGDGGSGIENGPGRCRVGATERERVLVR